MTKMSKGFLFDLNRCTGCHACIAACTIENRQSQHRNWREVYTFNETHHPGLPLFHLSLSCNHCEKPLCLCNCPALAYGRDEASGAVFIDPKKCMGCKYCTWVCPYDAPRYDASTGITEKCHLCKERVGQGQKPACVVACPTAALRFEDQQLDEESRPVPGFTQAGIKPALRLVPLRRERRGPESSAAPDPGSLGRLFESSLKIPPRKITLKSERALLLFSFIAYLLVAFLTASVVAGITVNPLLFLGAGVIGMAATVHHLGKKFRLFRAVLNVRRSWLSREVSLFSLFLLLSGTWLIVFPGVLVLGWAAVLVGFVSLFAIDKIYQRAMQVGALNFHSAQVTFTGLFLTAVLVRNFWLFGLFGVIKLSLYLFRKYRFKKAGRRIRTLLSISRLGFGFLLPLLLMAAADHLTAINSHVLITVSIILAELIDRIEFYDEMDVITPEKQMLIDLTSALRS